MIVFVHKNGKELQRILRDGLNVSMQSGDIVGEIIRISYQNEEELIVWVEEKFLESLNIDTVNTIFSHPHIMASYAIENQYFSDGIGYVDQLPFVNPSYKVKYPTWMMSTDIGGIQAGVVKAFARDFGGFKDFGFFLNSIAKLGQQNSLLCSGSF